MAENLRVRPATDRDWSGIWKIIREVAATGETMPMDRSPAELEAFRNWMTPHPGRVVVIDDALGTILGTANIYANRPAQGAHVASGSLMVAEQARGQGVGRALVKDMISWATDAGFAAIQFNAVVETNDSAIHLYASEGFTILGTAPGAFNHPRMGAVGLHIMWRQLQNLGERTGTKLDPQTPGAASCVAADAGVRDHESNQKQSCHVERGC